MSGRSATVSFLHVKSACEACSVRRLCLPVGLGDHEIAVMDRVVRRRVGLKKGDFVYRIGDQFTALYAIQTGSVKTYGLTLDGREQITGFHLSGELLGIDAIEVDRHPCSAVVLEDTEICELPFKSLETLVEGVPTLQRVMARIMSREVLREENMLMLLGSTSAEQRIARFLLNLSERQIQRGGEPDVVRLSMTRQDIGNYLGMALETVSRQLAHLQESGIIRVANRRIHLVNPARLRQQVE